MPVNKVRGRGSYAPLSAHAYKDDALAEAGEAAELLFYRGLSFAADVINDGYISDSQLGRLLGWGMKDVQRRARRLTEVGLWTREDGGYRIKSWLKWNRSRDEIERLQRKDAGRKAAPAPDPSGGDDDPDLDSERNPNGIHMDSDSDMTLLDAGFQTPKPTPEPEPDTEPVIGRASQRAHKRATAPPTHLLVTADMREWATGAGVTANLDSETDAFLDFHRAKGSTFKDWHAAWRTWMRNSIKYGPARPAAHPADDFQLPTPPREVRDDPDPEVYHRWAREQRAAHAGSRT